MSKADLAQYGGRLHRRQPGRGRLDMDRVFLAVPGLLGLPLGRGPAGQWVGRRPDGRMVEVVLEGEKILVRVQGRAQTTLQGYLVRERGIPESQAWRELARAGAVHA